ncbi:MAG: hypothetical protein AAF620_10790 [Bacteroidota bacterium]
MAMYLRSLTIISVGQYTEGVLEFLFATEGRAIKYANDFHYEYFLKDHLGNTCVAFGNLPERKEYLATMESENTAYEESKFKFPPQLRSGNNHTLLGNESVEFNLHYSSQIVADCFK